MPGGHIILSLHTYNYGENNNCKNIFDILGSHWVQIIATFVHLIKFCLLQFLRAGQTDCHES